MKLYLNFAWVAVGVALLKSESIVASSDDITEDQQRALAELLRSNCATTGCNRKQLSCMPCDPVADETCAWENVKDGLFTGGQCSEPQAVGDKSPMYRAHFLTRCRGIVQPNYNKLDKSDRPYASQFIRACRTGEVTCNNGQCKDWLEMPPACLFGVVDDEEKPEHPCNLANPGVKRRLRVALFNTDFSEYCTDDKDNGVRYYPLRCGEKIFSSNDIAGGCEQERTANNTCVDMQIPIENPISSKSSCDDTCTPKPTHDLPSCCLIEEGVKKCSSVVLYEPGLSDCEEADEAGLKCLQQCTDAEYPYCCRVSVMQEYGGGVVSSSNIVQCTNDEGKTATGALSSCAETGSDGQTSVGSPSDVCTIDLEPAKSVQGLEISLKMNPTSLSDKKADCCCSVSCSCFGDPHCTSFFGDYQYSNRASNMVFPMVDDQLVGFKLEATNGAPGGIIEKVAINLMGQKQVVIEAVKCVNRNGGYENLKGTLFFDYTARSNENALDSDVFKSLHSPTVFVDYAGYQVQILCRHYLHKDQYYDRLDVVVKKNTHDLGIESVGTCCPDKEAVHAKIGHNAGFCFRKSSGDADSYFPPFFGDRRLRATLAEEGQGKLDTPYEFSSVLQSVVGEKGRMLEVDGIDVDMGTLLQELVDGTNMVDLAQASAELADNGEVAVAKLIQSAQDSCHTYADSYEFTPSNEDNICQQGVKLEAKLPHEDDWVVVKFFPASLTYCDNKIRVVFDRTKVPKTEGHLTKKHHIRLTHCTMDSLECGKQWQCVQSMEVEDIGVSEYLYDSTLAQSFHEILDKAVKACKDKNRCDKIKERRIANGNTPLSEASCVRACVAFGRCPRICPEEK